MIYLDSAAIVKLVHQEPQSDVLGAWLAERARQPRVTSALAEVEVPRAIARHAPDSQSRIPVIMGTIARFGIDAAVRALAASYANPRLRSLDAVHLATAQVLAAELGEQPAAFVSYDGRLLAAAGTAGLKTASPGLPAGLLAGGARCSGRRACRPLPARGQGPGAARGTRRPRGSAAGRGRPAAG